MVYKTEYLNDNTPNFEVNTELHVLNSSSYNLCTRKYEIRILKMSKMRKLGKLLYKIL